METLPAYLRRVSRAPDENVHLKIQGSFITPVERDIWVSNLPRIVSGMYLSIKSGTDLSLKITYIFTYSSFVRSFYCVGGGIKNLIWCFCIGSHKE